MSRLLEVKGISKSFSGLKAVQDVTFEVEKGEIFAVIGPNGAGKTTLFGMIAGSLAPNSGTIEFDGESIQGLPADVVCRRGIARTFQIVRPFPGLSVHVNVLIGALLRERDIANAKVRATEILRRLGLYAKRNAPANSLTLPERKRLEVARALATDPQLLLLDEVMAGLRPTEADRMVDTLRELNCSTGLTIVLIEHVMRAVMALAQNVLVLHHGQVIACGEPSSVVRDPTVIKSYLGTEVA